MPIQKGKVNLLWVEYEFATAVKDLLCHPKEQYSSSPPSRAKKKPFHLEVQFLLITVSLGMTEKGKPNLFS